MQYIEGENAGQCSDIEPDCREKIADKMIDNLISYHETINPLGFGEINATHFEKDWRDFYKSKSKQIYLKASSMYANKKLNNITFDIVQMTFEHFDKIFYLPIESARLIHGDYNTWNILLNTDCTDTAAVIDPFNCCWGDSELDLYQLNNANGKSYRLLEKYKQRVKLSENFEIKNAFYELFTEIMHYHDANVDIGASNIPQQAMQLAALMEIE